MFSYKVIYIASFTHSRLNVHSIKDGNNYFTVGWAGRCSREFKKYCPDVEVECWKTDFKAKKVYERKVSGVQFRIFPAYHLKYLGDYSPSLIKYLKLELKKNLALG